MLLLICNALLRSISEDNIRYRMIHTDEHCYENWSKSNLITDSVENSLCWEASSHSHSKKIPCLLGKTKVHYRLHNPLLGLIVSQMNLVYVLPTSGLFDSAFSIKIVYAFPFSHIVPIHYMSGPPHPIFETYRTEGRTPFTFSAPLFSSGWSFSSLEPSSFPVGPTSQETPLVPFLETNSQFSLSLTTLIQKWQIIIAYVQI
jgi:hypothetical protein